MKNIVLAFIMTAGVAFSGFAQDTTITIRSNPPATTTPPPATTTPPPATVAPVQEYNPAFRLGISGAPVFSFLTPTSNSASYQGIRFSLKYGLHADFRLGANPNYYFSTGLFMFNMGGKISHPIVSLDGVAGTRETDYRINYVNIPITLLLRTNEIGYIRYFARVGFDAGVNVRSTADTRDSFAGGTNVTEDRDVTSHVNLFRVGLHIEAGLEYNIGGNTNMMLSLEWNNGLNNVFRDNKYREFNEGEVLNSSSIKSVSNFVAVNVGVYF